MIYRLMVRECVRIHASTYVLFSYTIGFLVDEWAVILRRRRGRTEVCFSCGGALENDNMSR